ncbi:MAG: flagellar basal body P-ring protein FlgI [Vampirovibrionales bacterium]|nr:flagellar basal body P-ring protein FlgI [Vampirovibrionales bacterium]
MWFSFNLSCFAVAVPVLAKRWVASLLPLLLLLPFGGGFCPVQAANLRLKDITHIKGVRLNQIVGYGLVVGLAKTGDQSRSTLNAEFNFLRNMGGRLANPNDIRSTNTAAVIVTATIPPFAKAGDRLDVVVSSMADSKSLEGGVLVSTQLQAPSGEIIALAQGPISTGGTSVDAGGSSKRTAITTTGRIPQGGIMERDIQTDIGDEYGMDVILDRTDFTMAQRVAETITKQLAPARATDASTIRVNFPDKFLDNRVGFISLMENLSVNSIDQIAKIVVNERTGTIVIGNAVRLLPAAVAHGGITVTVDTTNSVSQPNALAQGESIGVTNSKIEIEEKPGSLIQLSANSTLSDLVGALNAIGVTPNDLISILQALKAAGSLEAELQII